MIEKDERKCDVCGSIIPKGTTYRVSRIPPERGTVLLDTTDPDMRITWTQESDGNVRIDICLECHISMGKIASTEMVN